MYGQKELREHLQRKLDVSDRQMRRLVAAKADALPSTKQQALGVLAYENHMRLRDYLTNEQIAEVRALTQQLPREAEPPNPTRKQAPKAAREIVVTELRLGKTKVPKNALSQKHVEDAERMAEVYPKLYAFENSMREYIDGHLTAVYGDVWWDDPKIVNTAIRRRVDRNRNAETNHRYHSKRNARPIYYTDIGDLPDIATSENGWRVFKALLPSDKWLYGRVEVIEASRNVVAHMNLLAKRDIDRIELNFEDWLEQIKDTRPPTS